MFWQVRRGGQFHTAAQNAPMGWAIAAAIGASFAKPKTIHWVLTGDGCMLMHGMEIAVAARYQRRVVIVLSENGGFGRIAARFKHLPDEKIAPFVETPMVDWVNYAAALGAHSRHASNMEQFSAALKEAASGEGTWVIVTLTQAAAVNPFAPSSFSSSVEEFTNNLSA
jgi:acetolactate synthase-1/2/3 large subunit